MDVSNFHSFIKKSDAVYQHYCQDVIRDWGLNGTSFHVLMFLANHPEHNTARDLCRMRGLKTGIASVAIEQLIQAGLLERRTDGKDRRIQRLYVTGAASEVVELGRAVQQQFARLVTSALEEEELETFLRLTEKIAARIEDLERNM